MYETKRLEASIPISEYVPRFVDVPTFLKCCQECPNYEKLWSCPTYDFDVIKYWNQYTNLDVLGTEIIFDEEMTAKTYTKEEIDDILQKSLYKEKKALSDELFIREKKIPGSISLAAGSCALCGPDNCARPSGEKCRYPDKMRYSIESLGGNVGLTISKLFHMEIEWMEEGKLPHHFILISGLLY